jgi:hypothetical protein
MSQVSATAASHPASGSLGPSLTSDGVSNLFLFPIGVRSTNQGGCGFLFLKPNSFLTVVSDFVSNYFFNDVVFRDFLFVVFF